MQQIRKNKWDIVCDQRKTFMNIEEIASMSHRVSIVSYIVGAKEVFIFFFNMKNLSENFWKNIYCHFEFEHDIEKMVSVQEVIHIKKIVQKFKKISTPFL